MGAGLVEEPVQLSLFDAPRAPGERTRLASLAPLSRNTPLIDARWWFARHLEQGLHPPNTVAAYTNDLHILLGQVGNIPVRLLSTRHIAGYLDSARLPSTRKRRLTSVREFCSFLLEQGALTSDPSDLFFPERIRLKTPVPLTADEGSRLLQAAENTSPGTFLLVYLLLELGLTRTEVLMLRREHIDLSDPSVPVVTVTYDNPRWRHKERKLLADRRLYDAIAALETGIDDTRLFPVLPQTVNAIVGKVAKAAGIDRPVTPQTLRDSFAVEQARAGRDTDELLQILGLASDPRNRDSVARYIRLAEPPLEVIRDPS